MAQKGPGITELSDNVNGLADFESTADHGSVVNMRSDRESRGRFR